MATPKKCGFEKPDGSSCRGLAQKATGRCRHHAAHAIPDGSQTIGYVDRRLVEEEPGVTLEFWNDYNTMEIHNYVNRATGGRVELPLHLSHERMAAQAVEVLSP